MLSQPTTPNIYSLHYDNVALYPVDTTRPFAGIIKSISTELGLGL